MAGCARQVLGLVGTNGIGKSTALKILAGKLKPNLGMFNNPPDWQDILTYFRGSELQVRGVRSSSSPPLASGRGSRLAAAAALEPPFPHVLTRGVCCAIC